MNAQVNENKIEVLVFKRTEGNAEYTEIYSWVDNRDPSTFEAYKADVANQGYKGLQFMSWDEYNAIASQENLKRYNLNKPVEISGADFADKLNILTPVNWVRNDTYSIFMLSECLTGNIFSFYVEVRSTNRCFEVNAERGTSYSDLFKWCSEA
jgi:hypothetical protein